MTTIKLSRDAGGAVTYGIPFSSSGSIVSLTATGTDSISVPSNATTAFLSYTPGATVLVSPTATPIAPSGTFSSADSEINPSVLSLLNVQNLYFLAIDASIIKVTFYEGGSN